MIALLKKEWKLCLHPTCLIFLCFAAFVFIPNYIYEVMFFFSGLSVFFVCLTARENGDLAFTCSLPVRKREVAYARMLFCALFQVTLLVLAGLATAVKECCFPAEVQLNLAGSAANLAFLGYGALLLGAFNAVFFPLYFKNPNRVGIPFFAAAAVQFLLIAVLIILRFAAPFFSETLSAPDPVNVGAKAAVFAVCFFAGAGLTAFSFLFSAKRFEETDL